MSIVTNVHLAILEIRMRRAVHVLHVNVMVALIPTILMPVMLRLECAKSVFTIEHHQIVLSVLMDTMKRMANVFHVYATEEDQLMLCVTSELASVHACPT